MSDEIRPSKTGQPIGRREMALLALQVMDLIDLRAAGDVEGHAFHGNQWGFSSMMAFNAADIANPTPVQRQKLAEAYSQIDKMLRDPDIGPELWNTLSSFTPQSLKDKLEELLTNMGGPIAGGKGGSTDLLTKSVQLQPTVRMNASTSERAKRLRIILTWMNDPDVGVVVQKMLQQAIETGDWKTFSETMRAAEFNPDQPRDETGKWTDGGAGGGASKDNLEPWKTPGGFEHTGVKWSQPTDPKTGRPIPIKVKTVEEAVPLILAGKVVEVPDIKGAKTLIDKLAEMAVDAKAKGEAAPEYDLCQVSVAGSNLFCAESLRNAQYPEGIPRIEMPQLGGVPVPGSEADKLPRNPWDPKEVDGAAAFTFYLKGIGMKTEADTVPAASLKASQRELVGQKVAKMMNDKSFDPAKNPVFVSSDNYVVDGHHRWAAVLGRDLEDGVLGNQPMNIIRVNAPISEVLHLANTWAERFGISQAAGVTRKK